MKQLTFISVGVSFEDFQVFEDQGLLSNFEFKIYLSDSFQHLSTDSTIGFKELNEYADNHFKYLESCEYKNAVDKFNKCVENKKGLFFNWGVEYDFNLMFVEDVTEEELVDILKKFKDEHEDEGE
jgi:hypothetical protein